MRIAVVVRGGCVASVLCDDLTAQVVIIDFDNIRTEDEFDPSVSDQQAARNLAQAINDTEVYFTKLSQEMTEVY